MLNVPDPECVTGPARSTATRRIPRGDLNAAMAVVGVRYSTGLPPLHKDAARI
jgi:hypothetical protein